MTEDMLLVLAMSTDAFFAALSYSTGKIKIPAVSAFVISIISSSVLTAAADISIEAVRTDELIILITKAETAGIFIFPVL